jgi:DNA invertase Pin-like site-specific DNA recombinase
MARVLTRDALVFMIAFVNSVFLVRVVPFASVGIKNAEDAVAVAKEVGYCRCSTAQQSLSQQEELLRSAGCSVVFGEKVSSTTPAHKRKALQEALATLRKGDTLVVAKLDRLGRTQSEVVACLAELSDKGIYVRTLDGLLNTAGLGKMGPLVIGLLTGLAEVERSLIQERTRESVEHRRRTGGKLGGRPPLPDCRRELVRRLRDEGKSFREIAETAGVSLTSAWKFCRSEWEKPSSLQN